MHVFVAGQPCRHGHVIAFAVKDRVDRVPVEADRPGFVGPGVAHWLRHYSIAYDGDWDVDERMVQGVWFLCFPP